MRVDTTGIMPTRMNNAILEVPDEVGELRLGLSKERLICMTGCTRRGNRIVRHLKITRKGMTLI